jgi:hypothetical protein
MEVISQRLALPVTGTLARASLKRIAASALSTGTGHRPCTLCSRPGPRRVAAVRAPRAQPSGRNVAIMARASSLSAAYYRRTKGMLHAVAMRTAARGHAALRHPEYRLPGKRSTPKSTPCARWRTICMNTRWGLGFYTRGIEARYDAVFLAIGAQGAQPPVSRRRLGAVPASASCPGIRAPRRHRADVIVLGAAIPPWMRPHRNTLGARVRIFYRRNAERPCLMKKWRSRRRRRRDRIPVALPFGKKR